MLLVFESQIKDKETILTQLKKKGAKAIFDESKTYGLNHIYMALYQTIRAFENKSNFADDFSLEYLIRLSGEKQISKSLNFGLKDGSSRVGVIIDEEKKDGIIEILGPPTSAGKFDKLFLKRFFEIKDIDNQIETEKKIFEKIALLNKKT